MKTVAFFASLSLLAVAAGEERALEDVFGPATPQASMERLPAPMEVRAASKEDSFWSVRTPENCVFPFELVIMQDDTNSFQNDLIEMKLHQIPQLVAYLEQKHPGSTIGLTTFRDKPLAPFGSVPKPGDLSDFCYRPAQALTADSSLVVAAYDKQVASGGADYKENQFGALLDTCADTSLGWRSNPIATRMVVVVTDSGPHFYDPSLTAADLHGMTPPTGAFKDPDAQCLSEYYPTPDQVNSMCKGGRIYNAFIVFDDTPKALSDWEWYNAFIGQSVDFIREGNADSSTFWPNLSQIIAKLEGIECQPITTPAPAPPAEVVFVNDLSYSFTNDLANLRVAAGRLIDQYSAVFSQGVSWGAASFIDKPIRNFGSKASGDYCYRVEQPLTSDGAKLLATLDGYKTRSGLDFKEASIDALIFAVRNLFNAATSTSLTGDRILLLSTDAYPHLAGDAADLALCDTLGQAAACATQDYCSVKQAFDVLQAEKISVAFLVTMDVLPYWNRTVGGYPNVMIMPLKADSSNYYDVASAAISSFHPSQ